jgi:LPS-assembly protein
MSLSLLSLCHSGRKQGLVPHSPGARGAAFLLAIAFTTCYLFYFFFAVPALAMGPQAFSGDFKLDKKGLSDALQNSWNIEADKLSHNQEKQLYEAEGNVRITSKDRVLTADYASLDMQSKRADLWGHVTVQYGLNWLKGEHVLWNLESETGWLDNGVLFFAQNNFFIQGKSIAKTGETEFEMKEGFLTSCNPGDPDWKIQYREMNIEVGGNAWIKEGSMWARNLPVVYVPILGVPVETERKSGFLLPWGGTSTLGGVDFELPYYWAMRDDMDSTFYGRYFEKRGFMSGAEYRINSSEWGKGIVQFNFIQDQADRQFLQDKGYPFQAENRFWLRSRYDVELPWEIKAKVDLDLVSDRSFLQEFNSGSSSFRSADKTFRDYFGRGILYDDTSLVRESAIYLEKRGESDLLSMDIRYWQQLDRVLDPTTVQKLPSFSYTSIPKWIDNTPFYYTMESSAVNYWRREGDNEQRLDLHPRIYYPLHWGNYLDVEPSVGFRTTTYAVEWENSNFDNLNERTVSDAKVEMSTRLNRVFPISLGDTVALQHAFRPEVSYEYANQGIQGHTPLIDRLDDDQARNGFRYGFSTFLMAKDVKTDSNGNPVTSYREWARFRAFQFFNIEQPVIDDPLFDTGAIKDGYSPVGIRLDIMPKRYLTLSYDANFDWNGSGQGDTQDWFATLDSGDGHILRIDYQKQPVLGVNELTAEVFLKTLPNLYLNTYHDYSLEDGLLFKHGYGFRYVRGCWGVGVAYEREGSDNRFIFSLDLLGLGSIGRMHILGKPQYGESRPEFQNPETWVNK